MGILTMLADLRAMRIVDEVTQRLARNAYGPLREACELRVPTMTHAEARGYAWAKARPIVVEQVALVSNAQSQLGRSAIDLLTDRTRDRVVQTVLADLTRDKIQKVHHRRAA